MEVLIYTTVWISPTAALQGCVARDQASSCMDSSFSHSFIDSVTAELELHPNHFCVAVSHECGTAGGESLCLPLFHSSRGESGSRLFEAETALLDVFY